VVLKWDPRKAAGNVRKHGVDFHEAATVLDDPLSVTYRDPDHSRGDTRFLTIGMSKSGRVLVVAHSEERAGDVIRIITARRATRRERGFYEEG